MYFEDFCLEFVYFCEISNYIMLSVLLDILEIFSTSRILIHFNYDFNFEILFVDKPFLQI